MQTLSDDELEKALTELVADERRNLAAILEHLVELDHRELWSKRTYPSLFQYCTQKLGYSESAAGKRIYAARAAKSFPVIFEMIRSGKLALTSVVILHRHLTPENHQKLLEEAAQKTRVEVEMIAARFSEAPVIRDRIRPLGLAPAGLPGTRLLKAAPQTSENTCLTTPHGPQPIVTLVRIEFSADAALLTKVEQCKAILWHKYPHGRLEDVFNDALEALLDKKDPERRIARIAARRAARP